jgi:hypothetical protein
MVDQGKARRRPRESSTWPEQVAGVTHHLCGLAVTSNPTTHTVNRILIFMGVFVFGTAGGYAGTLLGFEFLGCFLMGGAGSMFGVYAAWKFQRYFR